MEQLPKTDIRIVDDFDFEAFKQQHGKKILVAVGVIVLVCAILYVVQSNTARQAENSATAVARANDSASLESVIKEYQGTEAAAQALLKLGELQYLGGKYADSSSTYKRFVDQFPRHGFVQSALLGLASALEAQGEASQAKTQYSQIAATYPSGYALIPARIGSARCDEALGQAKEARQAYEELLPMVQQTQWQPEVYLRWLALSREATSASAVATTGSPTSVAQPVAAPPSLPTIPSAP